MDLSMRNRDIYNSRIMVPAANNVCDNEPLDLSMPSYMKKLHVEPPKIAENYLRCNISIEANQKKSPLPSFTNYYDFKITTGFRPQISGEFTQLYNNTSYNRQLTVPVSSASSGASPISPCLSTSSSASSLHNDNGPTKRSWKKFRSARRTVDPMTKPGADLLLAQLDPACRETYNTIADSVGKFDNFYKEFTSLVQHTNNGTNLNMRRTQPHPEKYLDPTYLEKRIKNNLSAKRSRDFRRDHFTHNAVLIKFLTIQNPAMENSVRRYYNETDALRREISMLAV